jgi:nickel-dependent lactate racemase
MEVDLPDERLLSLVKPTEVKHGANEVQEIKESLLTPIKERRLRDLASKEKKVCIIVSDYTRAVPNYKLISPILNELNMGGCETDNISILIANGLHEPTPKSEAEKLLGKTVAEKVNVVNHDAEDESQLTYLGKTSFGTNLWVNKLITECDLAVATGLIEPHFFAGYGGGRKSILPGVAGKKSIYQNHSFKMIAHPNSRYGVLNGNPIHEDMVEASKLAGLDYIVNVVGDRGRIVKAFSGDPHKAWEKGVNFLDEMVKVKVPLRADTVIVSNGGYPLDRDLYQAVKGIATGELVVRKGGVIVLLSECIDGIGRGHEHLYRIMAEAKTPDQVLEKIKREEPIKDQWEAQILARVLKVAKIVVLTKNIKSSLIEDMHMTPASSVEEALALYHKLTGEGSKIAAVPDGPYVIPY